MGSHSIFVLLLHCHCFLVSLSSVTINSFRAIKLGGGGGGGGGGRKLVCQDIACMHIYTTMYKSDD